MILNAYKKWFVLAWSKSYIEKQWELASAEVIAINEECKNEYYADCTTNLVESVDSKNDCCFLENLS